MRQQQTGTPLTLFYSYAHEDELFREQLEKHLALLRRQGLISEWHDRQIFAGTEWEKDIDEHLNTASIILLLISSDFLASDYCYEREMQRALERHHLHEARVIPIIVRPCDWHSAPFGRLHALPRDGKAVTEWEDQDAAFRDVAQGIRRVIEQQTSSMYPRISSLHRRTRLRLLKRVKTTWIEGVLEQSLHRSALIALNLQEQPDALANPWHLHVQETDLPVRPLPRGTSVAEVYEAAYGELLLLGEPGAGKTTLLLDLARTLLEQAEQEVSQPIPIILNLSSWIQGKQPLLDWMVEELKTKYQVPRKISLYWIDTDQIIPLLDGLDEVALKFRDQCVQAINTYHERRLLENGACPLVVCCRLQDYEVLSTRVTLQQAVTIEPLTDEQIEQYLQSTQGQLDGVRQALYKDKELAALMQRPLMLNIFTLAYQRAAPEELPTGKTGQSQQSQIFAAYVKRMLSRRSVSRHFSSEQMLQWLIFIAARMRRLHETEFHPASFSSDWVTGRIGSFSELNSLGCLLVFAVIVALITTFIVIMGGKLLVALIIGVAVLLLLLLVFVTGHILMAGAMTGKIQLGPFFIGLAFVLAAPEIFWGGQMLSLVMVLDPVASRFWLCSTGTLPWNLVTFLDEATERLLLHKVGKDYLFIHRLLLDYFANLEKQDP